MEQKRIAEIENFFIDDINSFSKDKVFSKLSKLIEKCKKIERPIREELAKICANAVVEMFGIPEGIIKLNCEIVEEIPPAEQFHVTPDVDEDFEYDDVEAIEMNSREVRKRRIVNALVYGAANRIAEQSKKMWLNDIFDKDEELPHLYSQIMKINEYLLFNTDVKITDKNHNQGGVVETKLSNLENAPEIHARGIIFPILLHETIKGVVELIASYGLPDDEGSAKRVMNIADAMENEPWDMRMGPALWDCVCDATKEVSTEDFPFFFKDLVSLSTEDFEKVMKNLFAGTKLGKESIAKIYGQSKYDTEYDKFSKDLAIKRGKDVIEDGYFTEEEVASWDYDR